MVPVDLAISNLRAGEKVQYVLHRHWITLVYTGGYIAILFIVV